MDRVHRSSLDILLFFRIYLVFFTIFSLSLFLSLPLSLFLTFSLSLTQSFSLPLSLLLFHSVLLSSVSLILSNLPLFFDFCLFIFVLFHRFAKGFHISRLTLSCHSFLPHVFVTKQQSTYHLHLLHHPHIPLLSHSPLLSVLCYSIPTPCIIHYWYAATNFDRNRCILFEIQQLRNLLFQISHKTTRQPCLIVNWAMLWPHACAHAHAKTRSWFDKGCRFNHLITFVFLIPPLADTPISLLEMTW